MKTYGGVDIETHFFSTSALVRGEWSASWFGRFTPGIHCIGGWANVEKRKFFTLLGLGRSVVQIAASRYTD
jgi:hypothetical protein